MKKLFTLISVILFSVTVSSAQWNFGVKAGLNLSTLTSEGNSLFNFKPSVYLGAMSCYDINSFLSVQGEFIYSRQGANFVINEDFNSNSKFHNRVNYLNIPILAKFRLLDDRLGLYVGPQIGFMVNSSIVEFGGGQKVTNTDYITDADFAMCFGISYSVCRSVDVEFRYNAGLTNIIRERHDFKDTMRMTNQTMQLGAVYRF